MKLYALAAFVSISAPVASERRTVVNAASAGVEMVTLRKLDPPVLVKGSTRIVGTELECTGCTGGEGKGGGDDTGGGGMSPIDEITMGVAINVFEEKM